MSAHTVETLLPRELHHDMSSTGPEGDVRAGPRYVGRSLTKSFDGARVLSEVSVTFEPGEIHSVVGENGAGKSTLLKIMSGIYQPDSGELVLGQDHLSGLSPRSAQHRGIYLVPQEPALMQSLSVTENLFVGILRRGRLRFNVDWVSMKRQASAYLDRVGLDIDPEMRAEELSIAQQQLVECARALVHRCVVIYFDEPTSPLTGKEAGTLFEVMGSLRSQGYTLGFISHRLDEVLAISDRVTVLRDGAKVLNAPRGDFDRAVLVKAMIGRELATRERVRPHFDATGRKEMLVVEDLTSQPSFEGVGFNVREGEILGLAGLVGSGRTEVAETIFGLRATDRGLVRVDGRVLGHRSPRACIDAGLVYLPEDRGRHGIFAEVEVERNVTAGVIPRLDRVGPLIRPAAERLMATQATDRTAVRMASLDTLMKALSGGNQQRAMLSRWLLAEPRVAIFDEPTRGVDVGAKDDIYRLVAQLAEDGLACVFISSELNELTITCDRVLAMYEGHVVGELSGAEITDANLGALVVGAHVK
ncbi:MAG TPA: sugar ABC transporter ATP-binding protein [Acidimicrobiales bacterium]|nr:sugar ABC transporter ATP-binding protein [Acidimicrobiales bacterium]